MKLTFKIVFIIIGFSLTTSCEKHKDSGLPVDGDGNEYDTVVIGTQVWLTENLKTTKYRDGRPIRLVTDDSEWSQSTLPAYCWYNNDPKYKDIYGALYNWYSGKLHFLCPVGWHVPTNEEWTTLINYLGGEYDAGCRLKEAGSQHWGISNDGTNESGFIALPGGIRYFGDGSFQMIRVIGEFWASDIPYKMGLNNTSCRARTVGWYREAGLSVRCLKDK